ncbi:endonuclease domain-containing protein [Phenylobacterium montanum]|nr:endonuclease domain-containing protein [Caulobacter sp. S6]
MRRELTPAERRLWSALRGGQVGGLKIRRQVPIGLYIVDFACHSPRLVIECDGGQHADNAYDAERDAWLSTRGYRVLRFWNNEVNDNLEGVCSAILHVIGKG